MITDHLLIIMPTLDYSKISGVQQHVKHQLKPLLKKGYKITIITRDTLYNTLTKDVEKLLDDYTRQLDIIRLQYTQLAISKDAFLFKGLKEKIQRLKPDICHIHPLGYPHTDQAYRHCKKLGIPTIITAHDTITPPKKGLKKAIHDIYNELLLNNTITQCSQIICVNENLRKEIHAHYHRPLYLTQVIHNYIPKNTIELNNVYDIKGFIENRRNGRVYIWAGSDTPKKNLNELFSALSKVQSKCMVLILCKIDYTRCEKLLEKTMDNPNVEVSFEGYIPTDMIHNYYKHADAFINTSKHEGTPLTILEAYTHKKPIISTKVGIAPEIITSNNGILYDSGNSQDLCKSIEHVNDQTVYDKLLNGSKKNEINKYTQEKAIKALHEIYQDEIKHPIMSNRQPQYLNRTMPKKVI